MNEQEISLTLNYPDVNRLIEALLFASSVNIGADWKEDACEKMVNLAKDLKDKIGSHLKLEHVNFYKEEHYEDSWSENILKEFGDQMEILSLEDYQK
jgi:hypothetical protein